MVDLREHGVHVVTLISDLPSAPREHFIGIDNVVAGRTAACLLGRFCGDQRAERVVRYALLVTLRASAGIDIYTEIQNKVAVSVDIEA